MTLPAHYVLDPETETQVQALMDELGIPRWKFVMDQTNAERLLAAVKYAKEIGKWGPRADLHLDDPEHEQHLYAEYPQGHDPIPEGALSDRLYQLSNLAYGGWGRRDRTAVVLGWDSCPHSFIWDNLDLDTGLKIPGYLWGGLIFHGVVPSDGMSDGTFSVNLTPTTGWSIHT